MGGRARNKRSIIIALGVMLACGHHVFGGDDPSRIRVHQAPRGLRPGSRAHDWPCFLGPSHNGVSNETHLRTSWSKEGPPLVWEMTTGSGYAAPSVGHGKLVFVHRVGDEDVVECLDPETARRFWQARYPTTYHDRYGFGDGPRATPVIDGAYVYVYSVQGHLRCFRLTDGTPAWDRNLGKEFNVPPNFFGEGTSPLVEGDFVFVNIGARGGPCVIALDKVTGETRWKAGNEWGASYATPVPATINGLRRLFVFAGGDSDPPTGGLLSIDPDKGTIGFRFPFRSRRHESVNAASPIVVNDKVFISTSYRTGGVLLRIDGRGGHDVVWKSDGLRAHFATPIARDGFLYGFDGMGKGSIALVCVDLQTGTQRWKKQPDWVEAVVQNGKPTTVSYSTFRGSLIWADGSFLCLGEAGHLARLDLTPSGYHELARVRLFNAEESWTPPVLSHGLLYVTQNTRDPSTKRPPRLLCYDLRS